jgi:hypothetical protein
MPLALILEILQAISALTSDLPEVIALVESATGIIKSGVVTDSQEATIRAQLDAAKAAIDVA